MNSTTPTRLFATIVRTLCTATDRQLLAMFSHVPTAALEAIAMCALAVSAERSLYGHQPAPGTSAEAV